MSQLRLEWMSSLLCTSSIVFSNFFLCTFFLLPSLSFFFWRFVVFYIYEFQVSIFLFSFWIGIYFNLTLRFLKMSKFSLVPLLFFGSFWIRYVCFFQETIRWYKDFVLCNSVLILCFSLLTNRFISFTKSNRIFERRF